MCACSYGCGEWVRVCTHMVCVYSYGVCVNIHVNTHTHTQVCVLTRQNSPDSPVTHQYNITNGVCTMSVYSYGVCVYSYCEHSYGVRLDLHVRIHFTHLYNITHGVCTMSVYSYGVCVFILGVFIWCAS